MTNDLPKSLTTRQRCIEAGVIANDNSLLTTYIFPNVLFSVFHVHLPPQCTSEPLMQVSFSQFPISVGLPLGTSYYISFFIGQANGSI